jgi:hypothetical protein
MTLRQIAFACLLIVFGLVFGRVGAPRTLQMGVEEIRPGMMIGRTVFDGTHVQEFVNILGVLENVIGHAATSYSLAPGRTAPTRASSRE